MLRVDIACSFQSGQTEMRKEIKIESTIFDFDMEYPSIKFCFLFHFIFLILDLVLGVSMTSHVTVTNCHMSHRKT